jgi:hypothetical protein
MNARRLVLAIVVSLCPLGAGGLLVAPAALAESCPNEAARQGPSAGLPQCRVYEQVTPVSKGDAIDLFPVQALPGSTDVGPARVDAGVAAEDGDQFLLRGTASIGPGAPTSVASYVFSRGADGWTMATVDPPVARSQAVKAELFDPADLSSIGFSDLTGSADADLLSHDESGVKLASLVGPAGGPYSTRASVSGFAALNAAETGVNLVGGSEDLGHVILESENHELAPEAEFQVPFSHALYESVGGGECGVVSTCKLVNVGSGGEPMACGAILGQTGGEGEGGGARGAVSADGSRVFFTAPDPIVINGEIPTGPDCWNHSSSSAAQENPPELYMREDGARTVELSVPEEGGVKIGPGNPLEPAVFVGASANGSKVFFITKTELTSDDRWHAPELYEYNMDPGAGERTLTRISGGASGVEGDVDFVGAVSSDGSTVYFTAFGALAPGAAPLPGGEGRTPLSAPVNLYSYSTLTGVTTYITTVNAGDYPVSLVGELKPWYYTLFSSGGGNGVEDLGVDARSEWYTTGDGQFLVFATEVPLTGYDNVEAPGASCKYGYPGGSSGRCLELYRYAARENSIVCVSCAGGAPVDDAVFARAFFRAPSSGPPRPISEDGEDVFFDTASALVPQVTSGKVHVYEWHDGTISLISSPSDPSDAFFLGSSADGSNVFFSTHAQLSPADTDQSTDIYDARVDGGFAELAVPQCAGTGCQGVPAAPPIFATPASVTFEGVGNFPTSEPAAKPASKPQSKAKSKPKKCRAGFARKHGKCVRVGKPAERSARGGK